MELSLSGEGVLFEGEIGLRRLRRLAEIQIRRALEPITGVAAVRIRGGLEEEIHVMLDQDALRRTGLSIQSVIGRLQQENINVAGGLVKEGRSEYTYAPSTNTSTRSRLKTPSCGETLRVN